MGDVIISSQVPAAMNQELEKIAKETKRPKSDLIREAISSFIGMYKNAARTS